MASGQSLASGFRRALERLPKTVTPLEIPLRILAVADLILAVVIFVLTKNLLATLFLVAVAIGLEAAVPRILLSRQPQAPSWRHSDPSTLENTLGRWREYQTTGILRVRGAGSACTIYVQEGNVVFGAGSDAVGTEPILEMLKKPSEQLTVTIDRRPLPRFTPNITTPTLDILESGLQRRQNLTSRASTLLPR